MGVFRRPYPPKRRRKPVYSRTPVTHSATAADTLGMTESVPRRAIWRPVVADSLDLIPAAGRVATFRQSPADSLHLAPVAGRTAIYRKIAADILSGVETLARRVDFRTTVTESLGLAGAMAGRADYHTALSDLLEFLDVAAGGGRVAASAVDALGMTESAGPGYHIRRTAADTWQLIPATARRADYRTTVTDALDLLEEVSYPVPADSGSIDIEPYEDSSQGSNNVINITNNEQACRAGDPWNALEFRNIDAPRYAIPTAAYLNLYVITNDDPGLTIHLQKTESPAALSTTASDISTRTPLTTGVAWSAANIGTGYKASPDFSDDMAEVFALSGWTRGTSDLVVILHDNGTGGYLRYGTSEHSDTAKRPHLVIEWYIGGLTITATAADTIELLEDASRRAVIAAATQDAVSLAAATATTIGLLVADSLDLLETINVLTRLTVADYALIGSSVYMTYAMSITEPVDFFETLNRIAALRAQSVDALDYIETVRTKVSTAAGDYLDLADGLTARRILAGLIADAVRFDEFLSVDIPGLLEAIAMDRWNLSAALSSGWHTSPTAADSLDFSETLAGLRRFLATAADVGALHDVAALMLRARATAVDAAEFAASLNTLMRTRAVDTLSLSDDVIANVAFILHAIATDILALSDGMVTNWKVTARDTMEFVATIAAVMHWVEEVQDALGLSGVAVFLIPNGIVRIEFAINAVTVQFDIAMPRADLSLIQPTITIAGHGLQED